MNYRNFYIDNGPPDSGLGTYRFNGGVPRMPQFYRTFKRSCTNWQEFASARKMTEDTGLTYEQARERCDRFNSNRTPKQIWKGTKMEFEAQ